MQNGPPYTGQVWFTSALPPKSLTTAQPSGAVFFPNVTDTIWIGDVPAQAGWLYDSHSGSPGRQNCDRGLVKGEVWPISQTNAFGASFTSPQPCELPTAWTS